MKNITASQVMTRDVLTVGASWPVDQLAEFLADHSISGAPVVSESGVPIGVVSLTDLARNGTLPDRNASLPHAYYSHGLEVILGRGEAASFRVLAASETTARDVMTGVVFSVDEETPVQEVANVMITGRIHRVLVTRGNKMVGIISSLDLLPLVRDLPSSV
jgi:CBS domain-containing protein